MRYLLALIPLFLLLSSGQGAAETVRPNHFLTEPLNEPAFFEYLSPEHLAEQVSEMVGTHARRVAQGQDAFGQVLESVIDLAISAVANSSQRSQVYDDTGAPFATLRGSLISPVNLTAVNGYGDRERPESYTTMRHSGMSYATPEPVPVFAVARGVVVHVGVVDGLGRVVVVDHGDAYHTVYAQLLDVEVSAWQAVRAGDRLGTGGATSTFGGPEVYFELRYEGVPLDPADWFATPEDP